VFYIIVNKLCECSRQIGKGGIGTVALNHGLGWQKEKSTWSSCHEIESNLGTNFLKDMCIA